MPLGHEADFRPGTRSKIAAISSLPMSPRTPFCRSSIRIVRTQSGKYRRAAINLSSALTAGGAGSLFCSGEEHATPGFVDGADFVVDETRFFTGLANGVLRDSVS